MAVDDVVRLLGTNPVYRSRVTCHQVSDPEPARSGTLDAPLPGALDAYLNGNGIRLYSHQCEAINSLRAGKNVIITTPTASGKTLAFNIPVFTGLVADPDARALYMYPTKALSNDQYATLRAMEKFTGIPGKPAIYDGDTPQSKRAAIREHARIVISNPYELHQVLSWHAKWSPFFSHLKFVVIDEAHRYRGVFGSQIALLIRRLLRIARAYGADPQFVLSTATLANPEEFAGRLVGRPFTLVDTDGSPHGTLALCPLQSILRRDRGTLRPPGDKRPPALLRKRGSPDPLLYRFTEDGGAGHSLDTGGRPGTSARLAQGISAYRAGYLPEERRAIERQLKSGEIRGVVSTNALELGIDIGSLDAVIIDGYPGTIMSTRSRRRPAGKAPSRLRYS